LQQLTVAGIRAELVQLPTKLDESYRMTLERIKSQPVPVSSLAQRILSWVTFAFHPLTIGVLQTAMAIDSNDKEFDQDKVAQESTLVSICAGLIAVEPGTQHVYLFREFT
jgi:hypothetical protein